MRKFVPMRSRALIRYFVVGVFFGEALWAQASLRSVERRYYKGEYLALAEDPVDPDQAPQAAAVLRQRLLPAGSGSALTRPTRRLSRKSAPPKWNIISLRNMGACVWSTKTLP